MLLLTEVNMIKERYKISYRKASTCMLAIVIHLNTA
jgi:hypothetical protein